jgi:hypothetical protein
MDPCHPPLLLFALARARTRTRSLSLLDALFLNTPRLV